MALSMRVRSSLAASEFAVSWLVIFDFSDCGGIRGATDISAAVRSNQEQSSKRHLSLGVSGSQALFKKNRRKSYHCWSRVERVPTLKMLCARFLARSMRSSSFWSASWCFLERSSASVFRAPAAFLAASCCSACCSLSMFARRVTAANT